MFLISFILIILIRLSSSVIYTDQQFHSLLNVSEKFHADNFMRYYQERNLTLNNRLLREMRRDLDKVEEDNEFRVNIATFVKFCCDCQTNRLNCPFCTFNGEYMCVLPYRDFPFRYQLWFDKVSDDYETLRDNRILNKPYLKSTNAIIPDGSNFVEYHRGKPCNRQQRFMPTSTGSEQAFCTAVVSRDLPCPRADYLPPESQCDFTKQKEVPLKYGLKYCSSPLRKGIHRYFTSSGDAFCSGGNIVYYPSPVSYFNDMFNYKNWEPIPKGQHGDKYYFETLASDNFDFMTFLGNTVFFDVSNDHNYNLKSFCFLREDEPWLVNPDADYRLYNGIPSYIGNILLRENCKVSYVYNTTHEICANDIFDKYPSCPYQLFTLSTKDQKITFSVPVDEFTAPPVKKFRCSTLSKLGYCTFNDLLNTFGSNFTTDLKEIFKVFEDNLLGTLINIYSNYSTDDRFDLYRILNVTLDNMILNFVNEMGKNDSRKYSYNDRLGVEKHFILGNWFSGLFYDLIEPFFKMFIDLVLSAFLEPVFECLIAFVNLASDLLVRLSAEILNYISSLAKAFGDLLKNFLKLILGIVVAIETNILLFEYTVLFLFVLYKVINNWIFSLIIVIIFMLIFGIERKSPSFLMFFIHQDYVLLYNTSYYFNQKFLYDYSFSYRDEKFLYVYHFHNFSLHKHRLY